MIQRAFQILPFLRAVILPLVLIPQLLVLSTFYILFLLLGCSRKFVHVISRDLWSRVALYLIGARVHVMGRENVPKEKGFLYTFTHSSYLDIPMLFGYSPKLFCFGSKMEIFKIPVFGAAVRMAGTLPIARTNVKEVKSVYKQAETRVAQGEAFALAPEGGRRKGRDIGPFKTGLFIFAIHAKMPIVPVILYGVDHLLPKKSFLLNPKRWKTDVYIQFLPAISTETYSEETAKELRDKVREVTVAAYDKLKTQGNSSPLTAQNLPQV